jgi:D-alanyl-D-alanine dipeptidase
MEHASEEFVYINQYGLLGSNFYWNKYEVKGITKEEILAVGLTDDRVQVHKDIIDILVKIDSLFREKGYRLYIKEGYRSKDLYDLVYRKRVAKFGKKETDSLLNMEAMPHASGRTVDIALWDPEENKEVYLRKGEDGTQALFVDFYKGKDAEESKRYQTLQELLIHTMQDHGFRLGKKREYFHFDYKPHTPRNYG